MTTFFGSSLDNILSEPIFELNNSENLSGINNA